VATLSNRSSGQIERRAAVEAAILQAASDLLEEGSSFAGLSVEAVATRAGIGRTAFYFYFRDKRDLLGRLAREALDELYAEADHWWHGEGDGPDELRRFVQPTARLYLKHAALMRVVAEAAAYDEEVRLFWEALVGRFIDATCDRIEREQAAGRAAPLPARETATALIWMCERTLYQFARENPDADAAPVIQALTGILERAIYGRVPE
jgi:AcrR family transcriptional regulator